MTGHHNHDEVEQRLWSVLDDTRVGMLGIAGGAARHMQPMTAFADRAAGELWFFTYNDTELARDVGAGHPAMFCLISRDRELYACLGGDLEMHHDRERMDRYWNPVVAAWYPKGKDEPGLTLLRFKLDDAQVWVSNAGPVRFAWEIAKARFRHVPPDLSERLDLNFQ